MTRRVLVVDSSVLAQVPFALSQPSPLPEPRPPTGKVECTWPVANLAAGIDCSLCAQRPKLGSMAVGESLPIQFGRGEAVLIW